MTTPHLLIVDAQSLAARAVHVADGDITNGLRLWSQMTRGAALDVGATHLVAAWDHDGPTFRHALFPSYKHRRTGSMRSRIAPVREAVEAAGVCSVSAAEFEGDDCVATLLARFRDAARITLLSNDSDLLQFVAEGADTPQVDVASYVGVGKGTGGTRIKTWSREDVIARYGVAPALLPAFKALCGEVGDDIPGAKAIGRETAIKLLKRWQTLEKAIEASEYVSHRDMTAKLAGQHEHIRLMLQLTTIRQDAPLPELSLDACDIQRVRWPDGSQARSASMTSGAVTSTAAGPGLEEVPWPDE